MARQSEIWRDIVEVAIKSPWASTEELIRIGFDLAKKWHDEWNNSYYMRNKNLGNQKGWISVSIGVTGMELPRHVGSLLTNQPWELRIHDTQIGT